VQLFEQHILRLNPFHRGCKLVSSWEISTDSSWSFIILSTYANNSMSNK
jgi:hypothetical protein